MFHFQFVIQKIDITYPELRPHITLTFNEMESHLQLPALDAGSNLIGLGKSLTIEISDFEAASWFAEYALCIEFNGSLLRRPLTAFMSLEKLQINDQVTSQLITLDNESRPDVEVRFDISFKFKYVKGAIPNQQLRHNATISNQFLGDTQHSHVDPMPFSKTATEGSFLYGNKKAAPKITKAPTKKNSRPPSSSIKASVGFAPKNIKTSIPNYQQIDEHVVTGFCNDIQMHDFSENQFLGQKYYCPPIMEFTNEPQPAPVRQFNAIPVQPVEISKGMENYSFQVNDNKVPVQVKPSRMNNIKAGKTFSKDEIKKLVERQYGEENNIVVPVLEKGVYVLKKLNEVSKQQLKGMLDNNAQRHQPTSHKTPFISQKVNPAQHSDQILHHLKHSQSSIQMPKTEQNKVNTSLSADYPEDFESVSIGHSHVSRQQSSLSKMGRKREQIAEQQSISEIYSDNFDSFSQSHVSRSNVKKSFEEIMESVRSANQSQSSRK